MDFRTFLKQNLVFLDGGMGTLLQAQGLQPGEHPERWNLTHPAVVRDVHKAYFDAGSNVVCTNTFGANSLKFAPDELEQIIRSAVQNAAEARRASRAEQEMFVALDIGPTGRLLKPLGDLDFEDAVSVFAQTVRLGVQYGVDLIVIETMNDAYETKAALLAARENSSLPVLVTNAYGADGKLMTGASPEAMTALLEGMGADALGANCSLGPKQLRPVIERLLACASIPVVLKPNAGLPKVENGCTVYDVKPEAFADEVAQMLRAGVRAAGGCCGTTPAYIRALTARAASIAPVPATEKQITAASSYTHAVSFGDGPVLIGERINPTGKPRLKQALRENDVSYILSEGVRQQEAGVQILDVNAGLPDLDETETLRRCVQELQTVVDLPLQIDTSSPQAMEAALRVYNGKAVINSVNGKQSSMEAVFPLVRKYGGVVVALTLDDSGIPSTAEGRVQIARNILAKAAEYGIPKRDIVFDTLAMTVSAEPAAARVTLAALRRIREELGCHTILGVSNVSFGLPGRDVMNGAFYALALANGLSAAIMNPASGEMMKTYYAYRALMGLDENCKEYIEAAPRLSAPAASAHSASAPSAREAQSELQRAIEKGLKEAAAERTDTLLQTMQPMQIVSGEIIPALNAVGVGFEQKTVYLPQLLMSAEAAKCAFERIRAYMSGAGGAAPERGPFVLATVRGDIHDIGKNIVKLLLENYGIRVVDLGKDVPPEQIADTVCALHAPLAGLSALMTTTVPAMEQTIRLLRQRAPWCRIVVGGAVLTQAYADRIGADKYAADAMETVRYTEQILGGTQNT